jgi:hypothetical protein
MVTFNPYTPAFVKVAVVLFAALVPLVAKVTAAGGDPVAAQVYVRLPSPPSSAPSVRRVVVEPLTGLGLATAAVATVGGAFVLPLLTASVAALIATLAAPEVIR